MDLLQSLEKDVDTTIYQQIYNEWDIEACLNYRVSGKKGEFQLLFKNLQKILSKRFYSKCT